MRFKNKIHRHHHHHHRVGHHRHRHRHRRRHMATRSRPNDRDGTSEIVWPRHLRRHSSSTTKDPQPAVSFLVMSVRGHKFPPVPFAAVLCTVSNTLVQFH